MAKVFFSGGNPIRNTQTYLQRFGEVVSREVRTTAFLIQRDAKRILNVPRDPHGSPTSNLGLLRDSIKVDVLGVGAATTAVVYVAKEYGVWVEFGRRGLQSTPANVTDANAARAAWPPFTPIYDWVKQRRIGGSGTGRNAKGQFTGGAEQRSIAFLIQRKIAQQGIPANPFLMPAYERHIEGFRERLAQAIAGIKP